MKIFQSLTFVAALIAGQAIAQDASEVKQLFHVTAPKFIFDAALSKFGDDLDIWKAAVVDGDVQADIYATEQVINQFYVAPTAKNLRTTLGKQLVTVERDPVNTQQLLEESAATTAACTARTARHLEQILDDSARYTDNAFFDCWRNADEVFAFFDILAETHSDVFTKIEAVSSSIEGRSIPAYKLSTGPGKQAIYVEGLIHAREWHAGSTTFYTIAALLDGLRFQDPNLVPVLEKYDWYFVPIVNVDGFAFTHAVGGNRLWRKNRRPTKTATGQNAFGIDLNRNFGPLEFFNKGNAGVTSDVYPGPYPLSEPETAGIYAFLRTLPLVGALDVHAFSGLVLRPFGNKFDEAPEPFGTKLKTLGDNVKDAIQQDNEFVYVSQTAAELYLAYGTFMDAIFSEFNNTATLSFEMEGRGFVQPESVIRPGGQHVFNGIVQFARELEAYYS